MNAKTDDRHYEDAWDDRTLGADEEYVEVVRDLDEALIDKTLELKSISIRLHKSLIEDFKLIASIHGLGYQPLMRQVLGRFADCEKKRILREYAADIVKDMDAEDIDDHNDDDSVSKVVNG